LSNLLDITSWLGWAGLAGLGSPEKYEFFQKIDKIPVSPGFGVRENDFFQTVFKNPFFTSFATYILLV
jgi:hypothetical protein